MEIKIMDVKGCALRTRRYAGKNQSLEVGKVGIANSITSVQKDSMVQENNVRIRKLTAKECWRLMSFDDTDYDAAATVNSESQLYKQAGNSIVVNVLVAIFGQMYDGKENAYKNVRKIETEVDQ